MANDLFWNRVPTEKPIATTIIEPTVTILGGCGCIYLKVSDGCIDARKAVTEIRLSDKRNTYSFFHGNPVHSDSNDNGVLLVPGGRVMSLDLKRSWPSEMAFVEHIHAMFQKGVENKQKAAAEKAAADLTVLQAAIQRAHQESETE